VNDGVKRRPGGKGPESLGPEAPRPEGAGPDRLRRLVIVDGAESDWPIIARALGRQGFTLVPQAPPGKSTTLARALGLPAPSELQVFHCQNVGKVGRGRGSIGPTKTAAAEPRPEEFTAGTLAAGVAHEINNPLAAVVANLELALTTVDQLVAQSRATATLSPAAQPAAPAGRALAELRAELADARDAAGHVRQIVRAVRDFCRPEEEQPEIIDVRDVIDLSLRMAATEMRARARLVKQCDTMPLVRTTALRLGQVFVNLLINAAQAIEAGDPARQEIRIVTRTDNRGWAQVAISDSGVGIPPENLARVFIPFFTTKPGGVGSGLGLPICQRIVEELGGRIELESRPGQGTTVTVSLPPAPQRPQRLG
jgi:signal transduction histidine kinase